MKNWTLGDNNVLYHSGTIFDVTAFKCLTYAIQKRKRTSEMHKQKLRAARRVGTEASSTCIQTGLILTLNKQVMA